MCQLEHPKRMAGCSLLSHTNRMCLQSTYDLPSAFLNTRIACGDPVVEPQIPPQELEARFFTNPHESSVVGKKA